MIKHDQEYGGTVIQTQFIKSASISLAIVEQLIFDVFLYVFMIQEGGSS